MVYEPLIRRALLADDWVSLVLGHIARAWYCGWTPPIGQELNRDNVGPALLKDLRSLRTPCEELVRLCEEGARISDQISEKARSLVSDKVMSAEDRTVVTRLSAALQDIEAKMEKVTSEHRGLKAFSQMTRVMMHNLQGESLRELGRESAFCYRKMSEGIKTFKLWLDHTFQLTRPRVVDRDNVVGIAPTL